MWKSEGAELCGSRKGLSCVDMGGTQAGTNRTSPRHEWPITPLGEDTAREDCGGDAAYMAEGRYKLLVGRVYQSGWCGQRHPNLTQPWDTFARNATEHCTHPRQCWKEEAPREGCKVG